MAKQGKRSSASARRSVGTVRVVCPQCGKRVNVPSKLGLGKQSVPCPSCRVPINRALIEAATAEATTTLAEEQPIEG